MPIKIYYNTSNSQTLTSLFGKMDTIHDFVQVSKIGERLTRLGLGSIDSPGRIKRYSPSAYAR